MNNPLMVAAVRDELLRRFPGSRGRDGGLELSTDGVTVDLSIHARAQLPVTWTQYHDPWTPMPVLAASTLVLPGFALRMASKHREVARVAHDASRADLIAAIPSRLEVNELAVTSDDPGLASAWLDIVTLDALTRTLGVQLRPERGVQIATVTGCEIEMIGGQVMVRPATTAPEQLAACARVAALLATRPQRLGRELAAIFEKLGATITSDRFEPGRDLAVIERGGASVTVDVVRQLPREPAEAAQLRTRIRARRIDAVPREPFDRRLRQLQPLIASAQPGSITENGDQILLLWTGLVRGTDRLAPAIELVARLASGELAAGPYR